MNTPNLDRILAHHTSTCTMHLYHLGADRKCSCGRDAAIKELEALKAEAEKIPVELPLFALVTTEPR